MIPVISQPRIQEEKPFVRIAEAAERLDISEDTLMRHVRPGLLTGEIVSYRFGRVRTISWKSLLHYLDKHFPGAHPKAGGK